nr:MAG TPA: regulatory protein [Caudoviricetes sp.]
MNDIILSTQNGEPVASSREVAKRFGKEHKHVLAAIRQILVAENSATKFFHETAFEYRGQRFPEYLMNRDGFALLAMGFTGKEAVTWKLKYIEAFNQMEKQLAAQHKDQQAVQDENIQRAIDQVIAARKRLDEQTAFLDKRREARDKSKALYLRVKALCSQTKAGYSEDCDIVRAMETVVRSSQDFLNSAVDQLTIVTKGYPAYLALMNDILADAIEKKE